MRWILIWLLMALPVAASDLPALFRVVDVAADDVLNVRAGPSAATEILAGLAPGAEDIEVVGLNDTGRWGRINTGEGSGWVSMRYMARQPGQPEVPELLLCFGTEPFWSLQIAGGMAFYSDPETPGEAAAITWSGTPLRPDRFGYQFTGPDLVGSAAVRRATCSDGMSDRLFGLDVDVMLSTGPLRQLAGCCSLAP